jgi:hypothetical protein
MLISCAAGLRRKEGVEEPDPSMVISNFMAKKNLP